MKKLFSKKGKKGGLQFHMRKDEAIYVLHGKLIVRYEDEQGNLKEKFADLATMHTSPMEQFIKKRLLKTHSYWSVQHLMQMTGLGSIVRVIKKNSVFKQPEKMK